MLRGLARLRGLAARPRLAQVSKSRKRGRARPAKITAPGEARRKPDPQSPPLDLHKPEAANARSARGPRLATVLAPVTVLGLIVGTFALQVVALAATLRPDSRLGGHVELPFARTPHWMLPQPAHPALEPFRLAAPEITAPEPPRVEIALAVLPRPTIPIATPEPVAPLSPPEVDPGQLRLDRLRKKIHFRPSTREDCLPDGLMAVIYDVAEHFGEVRIASTYRDPRRNARVGGAHRSLHLECRAIDFLVHGRTKGLVEYLRARPEVGGLKRYPLGHYHIDNGPRRTW